MKKSLLAALLAMVFSIMCSAVALAYNAGQRTFELLGQTINSDRHPVHLVVEQQIDMSEVLTPEAYAKLTPEQQKRVNRTEYNESKGINAERVTVKDGAGTVIKDVAAFARGGYWYTIDYVNKTYDRLPELNGMSVAFAETLIDWFTTKPTGGYDAAKGCDYDKVTKGEDALYFYFEKDTNNWIGYEVSYLPPFKVIELSQEVNDETAFALPPADFKQQPDQTMRNYANRLMQTKTRK